MILPNKLFSYNQSALAKMPIFLHTLDKPQTPKELYRNMHNVISNPLEFMDVLDCLYALGKIEIDQEGKIYKC